MEELLAGSHHVMVCLDDALMTGQTAVEHLWNLDKVLQRSKEAGLQRKWSKCVFMAKEVVYLRHGVLEKGLQPLEEKVKAIKEALVPENVSELMV